MIAKNPIDAVPGLEHPVVQLSLSILFDGIGMFTYMLPGLGEFADIVWAPVQTLYIMAMVWNEDYRFVLMGLGFAEEILPFTDFIPSCTVAWIWKFVRR